MLYPLEYCIHEYSLKNIMIILLSKFRLTIVNAECKQNLSEKYRAKCKDWVRWYRIIGL